MISQLVLARHPNRGYLLIHRGLDQLVWLSDEEEREIEPDEVIRRTPSDGFLSASYELTEMCNVACVHCYLNGVRQRSALALEDQLRVIDRIEETGAIWLQISGGEPLSEPSFNRVYRHAWDKGFLITVLTNGTLLSEPEISELFSQRPPFRLSVSIYGATQATYERVTRRTGSWEQFQAGLREARSKGLKLRLKVIELQENGHELAQMMQLAESCDEPDHIREIIPTLGGNTAVCDHQSGGFVSHTGWSGCDAGLDSFHVMANGQACICKITREPSVPIDRIRDLVELSSAAKQTPDECRSCLRRSACHICPSLHRLLTMRGVRQCAHALRGET